MQTQRNGARAVEGDLGGFGALRGDEHSPDHIQVADAISPKNPTTAIATKKRSMGAIAPVTHLSFRQRLWLRLGLGLGIPDRLRQHLA
jgi:hypothetical protein